MLYAKKGERVTCENGHTICLVAQDIEEGSLFSPDQLTDWQQPEPKPHERSSEAPCKRCGARWFGGKDGMVALELHFPDGWRCWGDDDFR